MRFRPTVLLAARELSEARRSRWFLVATACFLVLSLALAWLGLAGTGRAGLAGFDRTAASLLNLAIFFVPLLTLSLGGLSIAGELEDGSLGVLLAQPLTRAELFAGKYVGLLAAASGSILAGFGATGLVVGLSAGGAAWAFAQVVAIVLGLAASTLAVGLLLSVLLESRARVVGASFAVWLALVYLCDLGAIGLTLAQDLGPAQVFLLGTLNPVQQARILGTLALTDRLEVLGPAGIYAVDTFGAGGAAVLLGWMMAAVTAGCLAYGYLRFRRTVVS